MKNLLYKELTLNIHPFFSWMLPLILSLLFLIPNWIYTLVFMYFFWISVPQIYQGYTAQQDQSFLSTLPVSKKAIVHSKILALAVLEMIHLVFGALIACVHLLIYGGGNFFLDINPAFFGTIFVIYGSFNIVFLPGYFRTAHKYGIPLIVGNIVALAVATFFEMGNILLPAMGKQLESDSALIQLGILLAGVIIFLGTTAVSVRLSYRNYVRIA